MFISKINLKSNRAFAVLFSIMLASFLITLGISIFSISLKETSITTSVRDSQIAYYIADSARECALYWDVKKGAFPACLDSGCSTDTSVEALTIPSITCNGINIIKATSNTDPDPTHLKISKLSGSSVYQSNIVTNFFKASSTSDIPPMADMSVIKEWVGDDTTGYIRTTINTWGHNTGIIGRRVERGIKQVNNQ